jgi:glycine betaine/proline transport system permease protein
MTTAQVAKGQEMSNTRPMNRWLMGAGIVALLLALNYLLRDAVTFPAEWNLGLRKPIDTFQMWVIVNRGSHPVFAYFFEPLSDLIDWSLRGAENFILGMPWFGVVLAFFLFALGTGGLRTALLAAAGLIYMGMVGLWVESMQTLALMGVSVFISLLIGIPLGIWSAKNDRVELALRPILDTMQTMPAFVYLIPVLLFFGVARVPSVVATVIYAIPPAIRLTNLGIRRVSRESLEAAEVFGSTSRQILVKVQIPLAMPTILAGVNQTIMMALGIVVIAALIGAGGLGREVLLSLQRLQVGRGVEAGMAIVFLAILLDRISEAVSQAAAPKVRTQWRSFALLPSSWERFAWARAVEEGLGRFGHGFMFVYGHISEWLASILASIVGLVNRELDRDTIRNFARTNTYWIGSLLLLLVVVWLGNLTGWRDFPEWLSFSVRSGVDGAVEWMRDNLYQIGNLPIGTGPFSDFITIYAILPLRHFFQDWLAWPVFILALAAISYWSAGWRLALFSTLGLVFLGLLGMWDLSMDTLSQTLVAVGLSIVIAVPLGILAARNDLVEAGLRPVLDTLQTIPSFVFLVPVIMLFNIGRVPGIIASVLYALPPAIRLTNLGIRQVPKETVEAARAFGSTSRQILFKVQLPLAMPSIMMGINQTVMMVLAMVIIAGLVGGGGLGLEAVKGLARNETGRGIEAGLAIVILAMLLDRLTQAWAAKWQVPAER